MTQAQAATLPRWRRILIALLLTGAVLYASWLLEHVLDTRVDPLRGYASELAATDQPHGVVFRTADLLTGLVLLVAAGLGLPARPRRPLTTIGWIGLALFAVGTAVDSRLPLGCTPGVDPACAAREAAGEVSLAHQWHSVSSAAAVTGAVISALAFVTAAYRYGWPWWLRRFGAVVIAVFVAGTVWTLVAGAHEEPAQAWVGLGQRVQLFAISGWLVLVALSVRVASQVASQGDGST